MIDAHLIDAENTARMAALRAEIAPRGAVGLVCHAGRITKTPPRRNIARGADSVRLFELGRGPNFRPPIPLPKDARFPRIKHRKRIRLYHPRRQSELRYPFISTK